MAATTRAIALVRTDPNAAIAEGSRALLLHRGPLVLGRPYAEWAHIPRVHAENRYQLLMEALAEASESLKDPLGARLYRDRARAVGSPNG